MKVVIRTYESADSLEAIRTHGWWGKHNTAAVCYFISPQKNLI